LREATRPLDRLRLRSRLEPSTDATQHRPALREPVIRDRERRQVHLRDLVPGRHDERAAARGLDGETGPALAELGARSVRALIAREHPLQHDDLDLA
jgi:hypothetical protein